MNPDSPAMKLARLLALGDQPIYDEDGNVIGVDSGILTQEQIVEILTSEEGDEK